MLQLLDLARENAALKCEPSSEAVRMLVQESNKSEDGSTHISLCRYANAKEFEDELRMRHQTPSPDEGLGDGGILRAGSD